MMTPVALTTDTSDGACGRGQARLDAALEDCRDIVACFLVRVFVHPAGCQPSAHRGRFGAQRIDDRRPAVSGLQEAHGFALAQLLD